MILNFLKQSKGLLFALIVLLFANGAKAQEWKERRVVDNRHPMWMIHVDVWNNADPQKIIDLIPEDIKPYVCMNLSLSCQYDTSVNRYKKPQNAVLTYRSWASVCCRNNMWFTCQPASGGHTHIQDNDLATFESFFKDYKNFLGWNYAEQFWGFNEPGDKSSSSDASRIELFANLVPMHHKYGGFLTISFCGNIWSHPTDPIAMVKRNSKLLQACKDYPEAILWLYKYTTSASWYSNESETIGAFVSGLAKNYGVRYDNCGWNGAIDELCKNDGKEHTYPGAVGIAPVLEQTALNGACVWDGPELIWTECFRGTNNTYVNGYTRRNWGTYPNFDNIWVDMFRKVIDGTIHIASRDEVLARTKVVLKNDISASADNTSLKVQAYSSPLDLYHGLYWQDDPFNARTSYEGGYGTLAGYGNNNFCYYKKTGRYATIPIVVDNFDSKAKNAGYKTINHSQYLNQYKGNQNAKVQLFNSLYPEVSKGDLFVARHKNELVCYYPFSYLKSENGRPKTTAYAEIPLTHNTCSEMDMTLAKFSSALVNEYADHMDFYLNNFRADTTTLMTDIIVIKGAKAKPTYTFKDRYRNATVTDSWSNNVYTCQVKHCGPVDLSIKCAGNATGRRTDYLNCSPLNASEIETPVPEPHQPLIIEGEDFDFKSVTKCVTDAWNDDWGKYRDVLGVSGMGFVDMGTSTQGSLSDNTKLNYAGKYRIDIKYLATTSGSITANINGTNTNLNFNATASSTTASNAWKTLSVTQSMKKGVNTVIITNTGGRSLYIDNVTFTPLDYEAPEEESFITVEKNENSLNTDMMFTWDGVGKNAATKGNPNIENNIGSVIEAGQLVFGEGNVDKYNYVDLSEYESMTIVGNLEGLRLLFNRQEDNSLVEINATASGSYTLVFSEHEKLKTYDYVHLNCIKTAWGAGSTVEKIILNRKLTNDMMFTWNGVGKDATTKGKPAIENNIGGAIEAGKLVFGEGNVDKYNYVDLSEYESMTINGDITNLRLLFNRQEDNTLVEINATANGSYTLVFSEHEQLKNYDYVHLNCIKTAWGAGSTVNSITLKNKTIGADYILKGNGTLDADAVAALKDVNAKIIDATNLTDKGIELNSANPNCIFLAKEGTLSNEKNVCVDGVINYLDISDDAPLALPKEATKANGYRYIRHHKDANKTFWGTICVPFALHSYYYIQYYKPKAIVGNNTLVLEEVESVAPGEPAIYKKLYDVTSEITFDHTSTGSNASALVMSPKGDVTLNGYQAASLKGTFTNLVLTSNLDNVYYIYDNEFRQATKSVTVKQFRAYIEANEVMNSALRFVVEEEGETAIMELMEDGSVKNIVAYYTLDGRKVVNPNKGIYVVKYSDGTSSKIDIK